MFAEDQPADGVQAENDRDPHACHPLGSHAHRPGYHPSTPNSDQINCLRQASTAVQDLYVSDTQGLGAQVWLGLGGRGGGGAREGEALPHRTNSVVGAGRGDRQTLAFHPPAFARIESGADLPRQQLREERLKTRHPLGPHARRPGHPPSAPTPCTLERRQGTSPWICSPRVGAHRPGHPPSAVTLIGVRCRISKFKV